MSKQPWELTSVETFHTKFPSALSKVAYPYIQQIEAQLRTGKTTYTERAYAPLSTDLINFITEQYAGVGWIVQYEYKQHIRDEHIFILTPGPAQRPG